MKFKIYSYGKNMSLNMLNQRIQKILEKFVVVSLFLFDATLKSFFVNSMLIPFLLAPG